MIRALRILKVSARPLHTVQPHSTSSSAPTRPPNPDPLRTKLLSSLLVIPPPLPPSTPPSPSPGEKTAKPPSSRHCVVCTGLVEITYAERRLSGRERIGVAGQGRRRGWLRGWCGWQMSWEAM
ncbi:hypothetical protein P154DRAFT_521711 [Amniculicola lignicola CBS 123094]|uniref:Uncharacterized protein n=1 Tax=Amniculicola lignicola CBS 123094 TaxID=1392246 RepID=A0A6A5WHD3_9PLEO|nr:hypothetical protein P154DRAFT_521711 [Amniculicola lignicola CBS 123094]